MKKVEQFCLEKNLSSSTEKLYVSAVKLYENVCNSTLDELLTEAEEEEEQGIRWKKRNLRLRLLAYRKYLYESKAEGTVVRYFTCIKTIYRHFEIELQPLPSYGSKQIDKTYEKKYSDIPSKQEIIDAFHCANNVVKCTILLASSTGLSKIDMLNLTVRDFIIACNDYITSDELDKQLFELKEQENVIPCFEGERQKTRSRYVTFCSPEAVDYIVQYLIGRNVLLQKEQGISLTYEDKLLEVSYSHLSRMFRRINDKLGYGRVGKFRKMRCHQLRAYHASTLLNCENGFSESEVDELQGRKKDKTHRAYFVESKSKLFKKYEECVDELMLFKKIHEVDSEEFEKVKSENNYYKKEIVKQEQRMEEQQGVIEKIMSNQKELEALLGL